MTIAAPITIPISFIAEAPVKVLAVDEAGFRKMMGYDQRSEAAAKSASWAFRSKHAIPTLDGGVYPIEQIQKAVRTAAEQAATGRKRMN